MIFMFLNIHYMSQLGKGYLRTLVLEFVVLPHMDQHMDNWTLRLTDKLGPEGPSW